MNQNTICHMANPCNGYYGKCLDVKITNACNGKCRFCIEAGGYSPSGISVERLITATNTLQDYQKVLILGGEPFMYPHLIEYLEGIKEKQEIYITTNGSMLYKWPLEKIAPRLKAINISIHHYSQAGNASVFGTDIDFIAISKAIDTFKSSGVKVRINTNLIKGVLKDGLDIQFMISAAQNLGADEIRFAELQQCPDLYVSAESLMSDMAETELPIDPFSDGCERLISADGKFKVWLRLACGLVNPHRNAPSCPIRKGSMTKVLYPDGTVSDGWKPNKPYKNNAARSDWSCHNIGCHKE